MTTIADLELRPATMDDVSFVADLYTATRPDDPEDPALMRHWWTIEATDNVIERWIATRDGRPGGFAFHRHAPWDKMPERYGRVTADLLPERRTPERLDALLAHAEGRSRSEGTKTFDIWAWEDDHMKLDVLAARGFKERRRERFWECDLVANREKLRAMAEGSRKRMHAEGIRILTLAQDTDPEKYKKLWRMSDEAEQDIPTTVPHIDTAWELFEQWVPSVVDVRLERRAAARAI